MGLKDFLTEQKKKAAQEKEAREQREALAQERREAEKRELEQKTAAAEKELANRMAASPVLDMIFAEMAKEPWASCRQSTDDDGERTVILTADIFEVKWSKERIETKYVGSNKFGFPIVDERRVEDIFGQAVYSYTKSGYAPLAAFKGEVEIPVERVIELWGGAIQSRLLTLISGCTVMKTSKGFTYKLPEPNRSLF